MKLIDDYDKHGAEEFESPNKMDTEDIRDMVAGYLGAADREKLIQLLSLCRDMFFER